jgi:PAS domain-containing protein
MTDPSASTLNAAWQLAVVMDHVRHGIVVYDRDERICLINAHVGRIFGFAADAITVGSTLTDYLTCAGRVVGWSPERIAGVLANHRSWAREGQPRKLDHHFDDGKVFEITFQPADDGAVVLTFADLTSERRQTTASEKREEVTRRAALMIDTVARISARNRIVAFNASIEAARLGEEGRGFAAVADEVRDLSRQMSEALVDIGRVIDTSLDAA